MKKLKFHEKKLLKKVDFFNWECDTSLHENKIMRKYRVLKREQYTMYNKLSRLSTFFLLEFYNLFAEKSGIKYEQFEICLRKTNSELMQPQKCSINFTSKIIWMCFLSNIQYRLDINKRVASRSRESDSVVILSSTSTMGHVQVTNGTVTQNGNGPNTARYFTGNWKIVF